MGFIAFIKTSYSVPPCSSSLDLNKTVFFCQVLYLVGPLNLELVWSAVFYYNYAWKDYGEVKVAWLLDMVKIMSHALSEGKLAVHCHAGQLPIETNK